MPRPELARCVLGFVACAMLGACSWLGIGDNKVDYKSAGQAAPLEVPPDLVRPGTDDRFKVPDINPTGTATYSDYSRERAGQARPGAVTVLPDVPNARVVRDGSERWLVVKGTPEQTWVTVKGFWQEGGFIINVELPQAGIMETDWSEKRAKVDAGMIRNFLSRVLDTVYSSSERGLYR